MVAVARAADALPPDNDDVRVWWSDTIHAKKGLIVGMSSAANRNPVTSAVPVVRGAEIVVPLRVCVVLVADGGTSVVGVENIGSGSGSDAAASASAVVASVLFDVDNDAAADGEDTNDSVPGDDEDDDAFAGIDGYTGPTTAGTAAFLIVVVGAAAGTLPFPGHPPKPPGASADAAWTLRRVVMSGAVVVRSSPPPAPPPSPSSSDAEGENATAAPAPADGAAVTVSVSVSVRVT